MNSQKIYETGLLYHHYANTAYPLTPNSFAQYKLKNDSEIISLLKEDWSKTNELSLYIHIPFCTSKCKFCEYSVLDNYDEETENEYVRLLLKEIEMYSELLKDKKIIGYDLGGGTPTKLSIENLRKITEAVRSKFNFVHDVTFSIETTPLIAANEPEKISEIYKMGYKRISMGIQTVSENLLSKLGRDGSKSIYEKAVQNVRTAGFEKFNIDLMYGFLHQTDIDFDNTLKYVCALRPEYITLYRNRYKGTKLEYESGGVSVYKTIHQYRIAFRTLTENGYTANIGKNTFSRIENDYGTSDYLTNRVINGTPYVGIGLGAQSFGMNYLSYNMGAAEKRMERYKKAINDGKFPFQDIYRLPLDESIAKMISVSFYFGFIDTNSFKKRFGINFNDKFKEEIKFVEENELMEFKGTRLYLTERGSDYINGVIPLFYSERAKQELISALSSARDSDKSNEELFLSSYNINNYIRPSVAADIAAFTVQTEKCNSYKKNPERTLSLLLIRRGEHPFINKWALPGGFLRNDETIEECAMREIKEETNLGPISLFPVNVFSKPDRDPRGRIISHAFASIISENNAKILSGYDAIDAKWFSVSFFENNEGVYTLILKNENTVLSSQLEKKSDTFGKTQFNIINNEGLAFDHSAIIASSIAAIRKESENLNFAFEFLPEKFTLATLQTVQETLMGMTYLSPNFRRRIAEFVEETNELTEGAGHRPARLFRRKTN